jgi:hypothetical protein
MRLCDECKYWRQTNRSLSIRACHYSLDTGELRGCPPEMCDKFLPKSTAEAAEKRGHDNVTDRNNNTHCAHNEEESPADIDK